MKHISWCGQAARDQGRLLGEPSKLCTTSQCRGSCPEPRQTSQGKPLSFTGVSNPSQAPLPGKSCVCWHIRAVPNPIQHRFCLEGKGLTLPDPVSLGISQRGAAARASSGDPSLPRGQTPCKKRRGPVAGGSGREEVGKAAPFPQEREFSMLEEGEKKIKIELI